jgi:hypothetical protein
MTINVLAGARPLPNEADGVFVFFNDVSSHSGADALFYLTVTC